MLHTIENDKLRCTIESNGAEIRSLINKKTGEEYIWQIDSEVWGSSSPVLFPAIGSLKDSKIVYKGEAYAMTKHGIIRNNDTLTFEQNSASKCSFTLMSSEETLKKYPFKFSFTVSFVLDGFRLMMHYRIENKDVVPMHFACGGHTAYACPLSEGIQLSDYVIEFPRALDLYKNKLGSFGLRTDTLHKVENKDGILPLSNTIFNEDALIFPDIKCDWVRLRRKDRIKGVVVHFVDYPHLALWSKPGADYVCIEPWLGLPDLEDESTDIELKPSYKTIAPAAIFEIGIETEVEV